MCQVLFTPHGRIYPFWGVNGSGLGRGGREAGRGERRETVVGIQKE